MVLLLWMVLGYAPSVSASPYALQSTHHAVHLHEHSPPVAAPAAGHYPWTHLLQVASHDVGAHLLSLTGSGADDTNAVADIPRLPSIIAVSGRFYKSWYFQRLRMGAVPSSPRDPPSSR